MSVHILGSKEGTTDTGDVGATANFPFTALDNLPYRRLGENRMAGLRGQTLVEKPSWNDLLYAHKSIYGRDKVNPVGSAYKLLFAAVLSDSFSAAKTADPKFGGGAPGVVSDRNETKNLFGLDTSLQQLGVGLGPTVAGVGYFDPVGTDNVFAQTMPKFASDVFPGPYISVRHLDINNAIRMYRATALIWRIDRIVGGIVTTELDVATTEAQDPAGASAFGIRINSSPVGRCRAFVNGRMIADFTLSAGAQGLTGGSVGFQAVNASGKQLLDNLEVYKIT